MRAPAGCGSRGTRGTRGGFARLANEYRPVFPEMEVALRPVIAATLAASLSMAGATLALAQAVPTAPAQPAAPMQAPVQAPARIGNVWGGNDHEIAPGSVASGEKAAGVALPPAQRQRQNAEFEREAARLLHQTPPTSGQTPPQAGASR
jgi:hypothetical protein